MSPPKQHAGGAEEPSEPPSPVDARINATQVAPDVILLEVRRMDEEAKKLIADLRAAAAMEPVRARALLARILDRKVTATPIEIEDGPRFRMEGLASLARMLTVEGEGGEQKPPSKSASTAGVEPEPRGAERLGISSAPSVFQRLE